MHGQLTPRADAMREIRRLIGDDAWKARWALLSALQALDLLGVNTVLEELEEVAGGPSWHPNGLMDQLLEERFGVRR
jgi:hypothetical protein